MKEMHARPHPLGDYLDTHFSCPCGREHYAPLKRVSIGKGAIADLPRFARELGFTSLYLVSDPITYEIAGRRCLEVLAEAGVRSEIRVLHHTDFDEATVGELLIHLPKDCDLLVAVGTGAINDMTRFFSFRVGRPFFTVATAAPMDGFASSIAALNVEHLKTTFDAQTPTAILGDTDILKGAPYRMIAADGRVVWMRDMVYIDLDEAGQPKLMRGVMLDVTAQKTVEEALRESGAAKDRFLAMLAHELRNPMAPIRYAVAMLAGMAALVLAHQGEAFLGDLAHAAHIAAICAFGGRVRRTWSASSMCSCSRGVAAPP